MRTELMDNFSPPPPFLIPAASSLPMFYSALASASDLIHLLLFLHEKKECLGEHKNKQADRPP